MWRERQPPKMIVVNDLFGNACLASHRAYKFLREWCLRAVNGHLTESPVNHCNPVLMRGSRFHRTGLEPHHLQNRFEFITGERRLLRAHSARLHRAGFWFQRHRLFIKNPILGVIPKAGNLIEDAENIIIKIDAESRASIH